MRTPRKTLTTAEFGDFQTPHELAGQVLALIKRTGVRPASLLEPTSGVGNFVFAAAREFAACSTIVGIEINGAHLAAARSNPEMQRNEGRIRLHHADVFDIDLPEIMAGLPRPLLVVGNPPWVTSASLGSLGSDNLPQKSNFQRHSGMDALTGRSNFDISEWICIRILRAISGEDATMAVLCKSSVARKLMRHCASEKLMFRQAAMYAIDAKRHFGAAVDACLFTCSGTDTQPSYSCDVYAGLEIARPERTLRFDESSAASDPEAFSKVRHLAGQNQVSWRSGIKHDAAKLVELRKLAGNTFQNSLGEVVELERGLLHPMLKSSDLANARIDDNRLWMLVTQRHIGEETRYIEARFPKTWAYLQSHRDVFRARASSIYKGKPDFSIFGVGDYTFAEWKVAISGMYKSFRFAAVGPLHKKPVVFDDTCYFLPCTGEAQARAVCALLSTRESLEYYSSLVHWGDKRPITKDVLNRLDLSKLARHGKAEGLILARASGLGNCSESQVLAEIQGLAEDKQRSLPMEIQ
ncbi:hypothetical protein SOCE26_051600 [Sorangium cellulosum]|uniref:SAM-dependent methyltransferase n=1 Tax=Sorangium cellulosum TaxID=56 RepID=A0A2L0EWN1_SORCE|nr:hypothetical protein [Sorangium cellulosum]AUX43707.1 hypothetical protein SOCE26_051600 [Sorangium cellulosum]